MRLLFVKQLRYLFKKYGTAINAGWYHYYRYTMNGNTDALEIHMSYLLLELPFRV